MPGFVLTVTRDGDKLMVQATGQEAYQIFPTSETEFFYQVVDARITFVKEDGQAYATSLILHQAGQEMTAKRIE
jgi:hypothetical protein